jgi:hypothetical protein
MKMDANFLTYSALDAACTLEIHDAFWDDLVPTFVDANDMTMNVGSRLTELL